jgi:hypothetical protein
MSNCINLHLCFLPILARHQSAYGEFASKSKGQACSPYMSLPWI